MLPGPTSLLPRCLEALFRVSFQESGCPLTCTYLGPRVQPCRNLRPGHGTTTRRDQQPSLSKLHPPRPECSDQQ